MHRSTHPRKQTEQYIVKAPIHRAETLSIKLPATELDSESDGELGELEHMRETEFVRDVEAAMGGQYQRGRKCNKKAEGDLLVGSVDIVVRVGERALDGKDGGVSSLPPRSVVTAGVTTSGLDVRNGEVFFNQFLVELGQLVVGVVRDDADFLSSSPLDPGGHIELAHGNDIDTTVPVVPGDSLGAQETSLLNTFVSSACDNEDDGKDGPRRSTSETRRCG